MKASALFTLACASGALADTYTFYAKSSDGSVDGPLLGLHSGAGWGVSVVGDKGSSGEQFNITNSNAVDSSTAPYPSNLGILLNYLAIGPAVTPLVIPSAGNKLTNQQYWACNNVSDPYNYSAKSKVIIAGAVGNLTKPFPACTAVDIVFSANTPTKSSTSSIKTSTTTTGNSTTTGWTNTTTTRASTTFTTLSCTSCPASSTRASSSVSYSAGAVGNTVGVVGLLGAVAFLI